MLLLLLLCATSQASIQSHPVLRHIGRWNAPPQQTPSSKQVSVVDAPLLGNGDLGITTAPHRESYPLSSTSTPANQTFWVGKNDFWSAATVIDGTVEDLHCQLPYTILSIGGVTISFPSVKSNSSYAATQNLSSARITTTTIGSDGRVLGTEGFVSANSNVLSLSITCDQGGCGDDGKEEIVTVKLWATKGDVSAPQDQMNCGGNMPRHGYIFPTKSGVSTTKNVPKGGVWVTRDSVKSVANSCVLTTCRDYVNDGVQLFSLDNVTGQITLQDGRCLHTIQETDQKTIRITASTCETSEKKKEKWVLTKGQLVLVSNKSSSTCLEVTEAAPHAHLIFCNTSFSKWTFDTRTFQLIYTTTNSGLESNQPLCLTAVNDNRLTRAAMSMTVSAETQVVYNSHQQQSDSSVSFNVIIKHRQPAVIILAVVTSEELNQTISSVVSTAETLSTATSKNLTGLKQEHVEWWETFWNKSWVDLDVDRDGMVNGVNNSLLESYYYGSQYILGSSSRKGKIAPGLFGPWNTNDAAGWNGDYTLNYNFQSPYYGVYSDNRPELAEPFFDAIDSLMELGKRRASKISWSKGSKGFSGNEIDDFGVGNFGSTTIMPGGYRGIEFPGHFGPFGVHDWTDRGQRSNAVLTATTYIDRVEYTGDQIFMKTKAYPFLVSVLDFFEDYMIKQNSSTAKDGYIWTSPDDCSMERCLGAPDAAEFNPIVTMGCLHRVLTSTLSYSLQLNVDSHRRTLWSDILAHLPPLARTVDPGAGNRVVFAESTKPKSVFGANSWFPLDYFASLHPGSGLGRLTSDPSVMKIALNTVEGINRMNDWCPLSGK
jgi:hypothetical protein